MRNFNFYEGLNAANQEIDIFKSDFDYNNNIQPLQDKLAAINRVEELDAYESDDEAIRLFSIFFARFYSSLHLIKKQGEGKFGWDKYHKRMYNKLLAKTSKMITVKKSGDMTKLRTLVDEPAIFTLSGSVIDWAVDSFVWELGEYDELTAYLYVDSAAVFLKNKICLDMDFFYEFSDCKDLLFENLNESVELVLALYGQVLKCGYPKEMDANLEKLRENIFFLYDLPF